jgi:hypothetical protein
VRQRAELELSDVHASSGPSWTRDDGAALPIPPSLRKGAARPWRRRKSRCQLRISAAPATRPTIPPAARRLIRPRALALSMRQQGHGTALMTRGALAVEPIPLYDSLGIGKAG